MCTNPILIRNKRLKSLSVDVPSSFIKVPCGQCDECLQKRANDLYVRSRMEYEACLRSGGVGFMCCLTYEDSNLPYFFYEDKKFMVFNKSDVMLFIKRLRTTLDRFYFNKFGIFAPDFKYIITSEYGTDPTRTHRPHYHALFFFRKNISPNIFRHCFSKCLLKKVGNKYERVFGRVYQCDVLDNSRGGVRYSCKYILKDLMYEPQRKAIVSLINFNRNVINSEFGIVAVPHSSEEEFRNRCIRSTKAYKRAVSTRVLPYRHMLQFYMLSNDLGSSYIIQRYGDSLYTAPVVNFDGFPYSLPRNVKERLERSYGFESYSRLSKQIFMNYVRKSLSYLVLQNKLSLFEKSDLIEFASNFILPFGGSFYLCSGSDFLDNFKNFHIRSWDDVSSEFVYYADNDFFSLRDRLISLLAMCNSKDELSFRASVAHSRRVKQESDYKRKKFNNPSYF